MILNPIRLYDPCNKYEGEVNISCFTSCMLLSLSMKKMETEVNRVLRGGSSHEVLSEGFGLSITRKDLQTLSHLNWLNDEVSAH